ncbi:MAG: hypothetical protein JW867_04270 [Candidatus Omnitrophica bacterium]|nr:hypothetical protein [Candidatus Omnitrophota bacterium]
MKITTIFIFTFMIFSYAYPYSAEEIVASCKKATEDLQSAEFKGKTITGSVNITNEEGGVDFVNRFFYSKDINDDKITAMTYCLAGVTYIYEADTDSWLKFTHILDIGSDIFDKEKLFCSFPQNTNGTGFVITFAGNDLIDGKECYCVQSSVFNSEMSKLYIQKSLDKFVPSQIALWLRQDDRMLNNYLDIYTQNPVSKLWISKDDFLLKKIQTNYQQMTGPNEAISISREITYFNFNKAIDNSLPQQALSAHEVSPEEMGLEKVEQ